MQLKGRVVRFSEFAASGVAITKIGIVAFSSSTRADSGGNPTQDDIVYLEIPDPKGDLEPVVEVMMWACRQDTLQAALVSRKPQGQSKLGVRPNSLVRHHQNAALHANDEMSDEGRVHA